MEYPGLIKATPPFKGDLGGCFKYKMSNRINFSPLRLGYCKSSSHAPNSLSAAIREYLRDKQNQSL